MIVVFSDGVHVSGVSILDGIALQALLRRNAPAVMDALAIQSARIPRAQERGNHIKQTLFFTWTMLQAVD